MITVTLPVVVGTSESERMVTKVANNNSVSLLGNISISMLNRFYTFTSIFVWFQLSLSKLKSKILQFEPVSG